jgi:hypothetical protein
MIRAAIVACLLAIAGSGCSAIMADGPCTVTRELRTTYQCADGGRVEHWRALPVVDP